MSKGLIFLFILSVLFIISASFSCSALRINEVEMNPSGTDTGNEWIEFYNDGEISLEDYMIINNDGKNISLNQSFNGYYVYTFTTQWLDNSDEKVSLYNGSELIDEIPILKDDKNDNQTHQFCSSEWKFEEQTKGAENNCAEETPENPEPAAINQENDTDNNLGNNSEDNLPAIEIPNENSYNKGESFLLDRINLTPAPKDIKTGNKVILNKNNYAIYGLIGFCILLGVLFAVKKIKKPETEFNKGEK